MNEEWCTPSNLCGQNEGDCDVDEDCIAGLVCGVDNCFGVKEFDIEGDADDCCVPEAAGVQLGEYHKIAEQTKKTVKLQTSRD